MEKIVSKEEFQKIRKELEGKKVAHCHGVFDLVHPGHLQHFKEAKKMADVLVVTVTAARYVRKGPGRPYFDDATRMSFLSAIECIDYVMLSEGYTGEDVIEVVRPTYWVKGIEYAEKKNDVTKVQDQEVALVRKYGGDICFTDGFSSSSTYLLNKTFMPMSPELEEYIEGYKEIHNFEEIQELVDKMQGLSVLVVGDVIIDEYIYCETPGQMSKAMGYSTRMLRKERSLGGSLAIARHAASFSPNVTVLAVIGDEVDVEEEIKAEMSNEIDNRLIVSGEYHTIVKTKYMVENEKRQEFNKLFSVNNISDPPCIPQQSHTELCDVLKEIIGDYDLVICCDFGHGLIDDEIIQILESAKCLAVNCQTNATNYGLNLITKFNKMAAFAMNQKELKLAMQNKYFSEQDNLKELKKVLKAKEGWLTRGSKGAFGIGEEGTIHECPAVSTRVKDTVGAGDAFLTMASLAMAAGADNRTSTFLGNVAGALGANIIGNSQSIDRSGVLKFVSTLFNI